MTKKHKAVYWCTGIQTTIQQYGQYQGILCSVLKIAPEKAINAQPYTLDEIRAACEQSHVVIREPFDTTNEWNLDPLIGALQQDGHFIQLETTGRVQPVMTFKLPFVTWFPQATSEPWDMERIRALEPHEVIWFVDDALSWSVIKRTWDAFVSDANEQCHNPPFFILTPDLPSPDATGRRALDWLRRIEKGDQPLWRIAHGTSFE